MLVMDAVKISKRLWLRRAENLDVVQTFPTNDRDFSIGN